MPLFSIPLSGLTASSNALSAIANNLANLNTVGYKDQQVTFRDLFYQTLGTNGAGNPLQIGAGAAIGSVTADFTGGNVENTGVSTDLAIKGDGFFVTQNNGAMQFTRAGNFTRNTSGELTTEDGLAVMGYPAVNGVINPGQALSPIQLGKGQISAPAATTSINLRSNLDASAAVGATYSTPLPVYDSLGTAHTLTFQFTKTGANNWDYNIAMPTGEGLVSGGTGQVSFDSNGNLTSPASDVGGITLGGLASGASPVTLTWNLFDAAGKATLTQTAAASTTSSTFQNGYGSGTLLTFNVDADGIIQGTFSNGQTAALAQVALANFANPQGLSLLGGNGYLPSLASGAPVIGAPGAGGRGVIAGGALELSNVDIAREFSKMIINQRGYQANAKVVTTFDEITQDTINLKR